VYITNLKSENEELWLMLRKTAFILSVLYLVISYVSGIAAIAENPDAVAQSIQHSIIGFLNTFAVYFLLPVILVLISYVFWKKKH